MQIKVYKDGKILLPLDLRKKYNILDNSELIITECEDGIKISTKNILLASLRDEFANVNLSDGLNDLRQDEFTREICG
jgi:bifunctional DNA-binding transcriptional regulator/antitoxin component of YhaV-PrlF toxin-antitoxin module